jgi:DNA-binding SARP family transcriptional activator
MATQMATQAVKHLMGPRSGAGRSRRSGQPKGDRVLDPAPDDIAWPLLICVLGTFRVLHAGQPVLVHGAKTEALLCHLALHYATGIPRAVLCATLWPDSDPALAGEALYSRVRGLHQLLGTVLGGRPPVLQVDGHYRLNRAAGVGVDMACFDEWATTGDREARAGHAREAVDLYQQAVQLYHGDLCVQPDLHAVVERERLRARYLTLLASLGTFAFARGDYPACLAYAQRMLGHDPCREDAHRLVMRCHVRQGERAQALHQFGVCQDLLRAAFQSTPEPETIALFEQVRSDPASV